jgi:hypothetical protein
VANPGDRYEPLPSLPELPRWLWRRMGRKARIASALTVLAIAAAAAAAIPGLRESQREADARIQRERAEQRAELVERLRAEQRPVAGRASARDPARAAADDRRAGRDSPDSAAGRLAARARVMGDLSAAIGVDARARVERGDLDGPIRRVACEPYPRGLSSSGAEEDLDRRRGRYSCVAVTAAFERTRDNPGGVIGHLYRARVDFATGRYGFCKIAGRPGPERESPVAVPRACGGP